MLALENLQPTIATSLAGAVLGAMQTLRCLTMYGGKGPRGTTLQDIWR